MRAYEDHLIGLALDVLELKIASQSAPHLSGGAEKQESVNLKVLIPNSSVS
jgi:hypothetical protein